MRIANHPVHLPPSPLPPPPSRQPPCSPSTIPAATTITITPTTLLTFYHPCYHHHHHANRVTHLPPSPLPPLSPPPQSPHRPHYLQSSAAFWGNNCQLSIYNYTQILLLFLHICYNKLCYYYDNVLFEVNICSILNDHFSVNTYCNYTYIYITFFIIIKRELY